MRTERLLHKRGTLLANGDRPRSWHVQFDDMDAPVFVSKEHAERADNETWIIPEWLWLKYESGE